jgi:hypothetical protein
MKMADIGRDPSEWSNARMTSVGLSIAGGVAGAFTGALVAAANGGGRPPRRVYSAKQSRLSTEKVHELELHLASLLLRHRIDQLGERDREIAELKEEIAYERYLRARGR